ncbi:hypothetical protein LTR62_006537 [Meristemomyces frigidus]|uniref:Calcineurin-like phosphoesterase domain-containing protein n=1 Tax=Meristemomyces frigidus TaxID=1508187 RepID=A0AAN7TC73_9PEZI|nr:hypothetical protein LTR62_006537 [Meristemomyces frigidus]
MHYRHVAKQQSRRLLRRYPFLTHITIVTTVITLVWIYGVYYGERTLFARHIDACHWDKWERWPPGATPHHLVLVADPQLVDPHTYPGRPWPLSTATERYTDLYMGRNFRLINANLDPDSVVFLGDLFDGGREWAPSKAKPLKGAQIALLQHMGVMKSNEVVEKRSLDSYRKAIATPHHQVIEKKDHFLTPEGRDLKKFVYGEKGRWSSWGQQQWDADFRRFSHIFFDTDQLYPHGATRDWFAAYEVQADDVSVENGADNTTWKEYASSGGRQRRIITSLPGNHDVGFGMGAQLPLQDRFQMHFGDSNRIDVIGNHTFVSIDSPSLSAFMQFMPEGGETPPDKATELTHLWQPAMDFLEGIQAPARKAVDDALQSYYPSKNAEAGHTHAVFDSDEQAPSRAARPSSQAELPTVLLTHIPLYRDPDTDCGSMRERGRALSISAGYQYQNVVTRSLSNSIVSYVSKVGNIIQIFSGDDHDYCDVSHVYNIGQAQKPANDASRTTPGLSNVKEITVKSFSWAMGVRKPGFQLVSLWNPVDADGKSLGTASPTIQTHLCLLPDQLGIFLDYATLLGATMVVLLIRAVIIGLQAKTTEDDEVPESPLSELTLPRYQSKLYGATAGNPSTANKGTKQKSRHRAASTSLESALNSSSNNLGVQRSFNARTRSVSPAVGIYTPNNSAYTLPPSGQEHHGPLVDKAGYHPSIKWLDPTDAEDSDEENDVSAVSDVDEDDSQAKWKRRRRAPGRARMAVGEFFASTAVVGLPSLLWYIWVVRHG